MAMPALGKIKGPVGFLKLKTCCMNKVCLRNQHSVEIKGSNYNETFISSQKNLSKAMISSLLPTALGASQSLSYKFEPWMQLDSSKISFY